MRRYAGLDANRAIRRYTISYPGSSQLFAFRHDCLLLAILPTYKSKWTKSLRWLLAEMNTIKIRTERTICDDPNVLSQSDRTSITFGAKMKSIVISKNDELSGVA